MNPKHAQYMITVFQEGSITNAAKKLYVSQPSLSQMVKLVETNLGTPIFNRSTDPLTLTYAGEKYIEAAQKILTINANLAREIEEINDEEHGKIRLGIPVQRGMQVLPYALPKFFELYPHVDVEISEHGSQATEKLVLDGSVDMACMTTVPKHDELKYIIVEKEELVLLASKNTEEMQAKAAVYPLLGTDSMRHCYICHRKDLYLTKYMKDFINILLEVENPFLKDNLLSKDQPQDSGQ